MNEPGTDRMGKVKSLGSAASNFGWGFLEEAGCNDNKAIQARVAFNGRDAISLAGQSSYVLPES
jgi:hypothetical protein